MSDQRYDPRPGHITPPPRLPIPQQGQASIPMNPQATQHPPGQLNTQGHGVAPAHKPLHPPAQQGEESISLVDHPQAQGAPTQSKIHGFSVGVQKQYSEDWKRTTNLTKTGSIRVRSFHGRLSEQGLEYMDHLINEWLDKHPDVEVKNVTSSVGLFDGKMKEPAVILNIWY